MKQKELRLAQSFAEIAAHLRSGGMSGLAWHFEDLSFNAENGDMDIVQVLLRASGGKYELERASWDARFASLILEARRLAREVDTMTTEHRRRL